MAVRRGVRGPWRGGRGGQAEPGRPAGRADPARGLAARLRPLVVALGLGLAALVQPALAQPVTAPPVIAQPAPGQSPAAGPDAPALLPPRRLTLAADTDLPGGDIGRALDVTFQTCARACLQNPDCKALTYNQRQRACFPKGDGAGVPTPFAGAISARLMPADPAVLARAQARAAAAPFIERRMLGSARDLAEDLVLALPPEDAASALQGRVGLRLAASRAEAEARSQDAVAILSRLVAREDRAEDWIDLARILVLTTDDAASYDRAALMAVNGYLRADSDAQAGRALLWLARALEHRDQGPVALKALRLAATLAPADAENAGQRDRAEELYGLRVTDSRTESDSPLPRFCAILSRKLDPAIDYTPYLRLPEGDLTVEAEDQQICVAGLAHGDSFRVTLRAGLPSADGERLLRDVDLGGYVRDRAPEVRFPGRAYVLPASGDRRIPVVTVNARRLDLRLLRVSDRNLLRVMSDQMFATPLDGWQADYLSPELAREVWTGSADLAPALAGNPDDWRNREVTASLAIPDKAGPLEPGIYVVEAGVSGRDPSETGLATQWFVISDFGITTFSGIDGLTVAVRGLADAQPRPGVEVALVSRSNEVLGRVQTDAQGIARLAPGLSLGEGGAEPALITVTRWQGEGEDRLPADMAFLSLTDPEFDLSDRGVEGEPPAPPIDLFATTDRGAYRVGETVNLTVLARDQSMKALDALPLTAVILRPDGVEQAREPVEPAGDGGGTLGWRIPPDAPRGSWRIELRAEADGPALASQRILVEDFLPERIDFALQLPEGPQRAGAELPLALRAHWLFGAPAANLPVEGQLRLGPARTLDALPGYSFGRHDDEAQPVTTPLPPATTDAQGAVRTTIALPGPEALAPRPWLAEIAIDIREGAGRPVERRASRVVMPDRPVIGIRPMFEDGVVAENAQARFQLAAVGPDLGRVALPVNWVLNRIDTDYRWYSLGGQWHWQAITSRHRVASGHAQIAAGADAPPAEIAAPVTWGSFELLVEPAAEGAAGPASVAFEAGWGVAGDDETPPPDRLKVVLDKPAYRAGETAHASVEARADGVGLVSVLSNRVVALKAVPLKAGENRIDLPVTGEWGAGVYVTVSAIRPLDAAPAAAQPPVPAATPQGGAADGAAGGGGRRAPVRALGLAHAAVDPGARRLAARIEAPAEARPRGTIPVRIVVEGAAGRTVHATVAAVDQGILNLTGFAPPDPAGHYFGQRRLGVGLRDLYGRLIAPGGAPDAALREGGDAMSAQPEAPPPTERLMSWFSGPVTLGPDGSATLEVPVGDFNGEVRLMAVAWSAEAVGQADASVLVHDPVVMTVTAPPFLAPGDHAVVGLRLTHAAGPAGEVRLAVRRAGGEAWLDARLPRDRLRLAEHGEASLAMPVTAGQDEGPAELRLTLTTPDGQSLTKDIAIPVALNEADIQTRDRLVIPPGGSITPPDSLTAEMAPGALVTATVGPYARLDVAGALARLSRYPYGCTEQLVSAALPLLYLPELSAMQDGRAEDTGKAVDDAIAQILTRQDSNGGFGLWYADSGDLWLESYVTDFLSRARAAGRAVPDTAFRLALDNLRNRANSAPDPAAAEPEDNAALAYALAVLARERAATPGDLRYYADTAAGAFSTPMGAADLGMALALTGDQPRADRMFAQARDLLDLTRPEDRVLRADYGSALRDAAALLALSAEAKSEVIDADRLASDVAEQIARRGGAISTQESLWTVLAAHALAGQVPPVELNGVALTRPVATLPEAGARISNPGGAPIEVTLTATGKPAWTPGPEWLGLQLTRSYFTPEGQPLDPAALVQGTRMVAVLEVTPDGDGSGRLVVNDPLPAGWEIDNPHLLQAGETGSLDWLEGIAQPDMTEFRADRFTAALTVSGRDPLRLAYMLRAVTPGTFRQPGAVAEDMYRPRFHARTASETVEVKAP